MTHILVYKSSQPPGEKNVRNAAREGSGVKQVKQVKHVIALSRGSESEPKHVIELIKHLLALTRDAEAKHVIAQESKSEG